MTTTQTTATNPASSAPAVNDYRAALANLQKLLAAPRISRAAHLTDALAPIRWTVEADPLRKWRLDCETFGGRRVPFWCAQTLLALAQAAKRSVTRLIADLEAPADANGHAWTERVARVRAEAAAYGIEADANPNGSFSILISDSAEAEVTQHCYEFANWEAEVREAIARRQPATSAPEQPAAEPIPTPSAPDLAAPARAAASAQAALDASAIAEAGRETQIRVPGLPPIPAFYALAWLDKLIPSHYADSLQPNPAHPFGNCRRYESNKALAQQIHAHAQQLDCGILLDSGQGPENGPPIITGSGIVLGGNSRTMKLQRAFANGDFVGSGYTAKLDRDRETFGLPDVLDNWTLGGRVVLVRVVTETHPDKLRAMIPALNRSAANAQTNFERALSIAQAISAEEFARIEPSECETVRDYLRRAGVELYNRLEAFGTFSPTERAEMVEESKTARKLTDLGAAALEDAIAAKLCGSADVMDALNHAQKDSLGRIAAPLLRLQAAAGSGRLPADFDLAPDLPAAIARAARLGDSPCGQAELFAPEGESERELPRTTLALSYLLQAGFKKRAGLGPAVRRLADLILLHHGDSVEGEQDAFGRPELRLPETIMAAARELGSEATLPRFYRSRQGEATARLAQKRRAKKQAESVQPQARPAAKVVEVAPIAPATFPAEPPAPELSTPAAMVAALRAQGFAVSESGLWGWQIETYPGEILVAHSPRDLMATTADLLAESELPAWREVFEIEPASFADFAGLPDDNDPDGGIFESVFEVEPAQTSAPKTTRDDIKRRLARDAHMPEDVLIRYGRTDAAGRKALRKKYAGIRALNTRAGELWAIEQQRQAAQAEKARALA